MPKMKLEVKECKSIEELATSAANLDLVNTKVQDLFFDIIDYLKCVSVKKDKIMNLNLTKEQASLLLEQFKPFLFSSNGLNVYASEDVYQEVKKIIDRCTVNGFPEIHMRPEHFDDEEELRVYQTMCDGTGGQCFVIFSLGDYTHLNDHQFREFAQGINKIVAHLDAQREDDIYMPIADED